MQKVKRPAGTADDRQPHSRHGPASAWPNICLSRRKKSATLDMHDIEDFFGYMLERIDLSRDIHFQTNTTIDTLDYSGDGLNSGSKVVFAACGDVKRELCRDVPEPLKRSAAISNGRGSSCRACRDRRAGISPITSARRRSWRSSADAIQEQGRLPTCPLIVLCDDSRICRPHR